METLICPLNIFLCPQIRGERDETPVSSLTSSMPDRKNVPKTTRRKRKSCQLEVCVCVASVCAFEVDCKKGNQSSVPFSLEPMLVQENKSMKIA